MATEKFTDTQQLEALLPAFVNGTASTTERQFVKAMLAQSAQARAALAWHEALAEKIINDVQSAPADVGWAQLQARVCTTSRLASPPRQTKGWQQTLQKIWRAIEPFMPHKLLSGPALGGVCAGLMAVVLGQAFWLSQSQNTPDYADVRGVRATGNDTQSGTSAVSSRYVRLNFKEQISERDMRLLLIRTGASIVSGPGQLGDYIVGVPAAEIEQALRQFRDSQLTESAAEVPAAGGFIPGAAGTTGTAPAQVQSKVHPE